MVQENLIFQVAVPGPFKTPLDYLAPVDFIASKKESFIGCRIKVPLRKKETVGILLDIKTHSSFPLSKLKRSIALLDEKPILSAAILKLTQWASDYYHHPIGEVLMCALPSALRRDKNNSFLFEEKPSFVGETLPTLNADQQRAFDTVLQRANSFQPFLLYGVTGSGKTEVYLRLIEMMIKNQKHVLVLIPEIGLTPQTFSRFEKRFNVPIALIHSGLSENEKLKSWTMAKEGMAPIILGTRSALFTPIANLGLIIIDEEHDLSFKQQEGFRYSARDLSLVRAQFENIPILLGSATPSLESFHHVEMKRYTLLTLHQRAGKANLPTLKLIDLRKKQLTSGLSSETVSAIHTHLKQGNQVLVFLNRRGFVPSLVCHHCGYIAQCHRCDARLILHKSPAALRCHHCTYECKPFSVCPQCNSAAWLMQGQGTQKLESVLQVEFPDFPVVRIDRDNTRKKSAMKSLLDQIHQGEGKILVGTQMLAKGHHFPNVTLVVILDCDMGLSSSDFRATERTAQLITQVAGRAGRELHAGEVLIQTHFPENALLNLLIKKGYLAFAHHALHERKEANLPPFQFLALIRAEATQATYPIAFLNEVRNKGYSLNYPISMWGPIPAPMEKRAGRFRAQLAFQAEKRSTLHSFLTLLLPQLSELKSAKRVRFSLDIDPHDLL